MKKLLTVAAALLPLAAFAQYEPVAPAAPAAPGPSYQSRRSPWYIGFGLGGASGNVSVPGGTLSLEEYTQEPWVSVLGIAPPSGTNVSLNFKVGMTLSDKLLVGFDITGVGSLVSQGDLSTQTTIANYDAVATYFPMGEGLFVRGGVGLSRLTVSYKDSFGDGSDSVGGYNALVGAGYAFWLGQSFNLTLNVDYSAQRYGSAAPGETMADGVFLKPESSNFLAFWVGFDWY